MITKPISEKPYKSYADLSSNILSIKRPKDSEKLEQMIRMGYGECSISGCPCRSYKDTYGSELCNNCGHKYTDHW